MGVVLKMEKKQKKSQEETKAAGSGSKGVVVYPGINIRDVETLLRYRNQRKNKG